MKLWWVSLLIALPVSGQEMDRRWKELYQLVETETQLLLKAQKRGDEIHYRLFELQSEKMKLVLERENRRFLESKDNKKHSNKDSYFRESLSLYDEARTFGESILKRWPATGRRGDVYYTLALNSRDFGRDKRMERYMLEALKHIKQGSRLRHHAETSLADYYYNEKKFPLAITYYERSVQRTDDDWRPKHYYNLGWCYLKTMRFDDAIEQLKLAHKFSKDGKHIDISSQVLSHIGAFFVFGGKISEGVAWYLTEENDPMEYLLTMARKASDKGHLKETEGILNAMEESMVKRKLLKHREEKYLFELDFRRQYAHWPEHLEAARKLSNWYAQLDKQTAEEKTRPNSIKIEKREDGIEKVRSVAGFLQLKLAKDMKKTAASYSDKELHLTIEYFRLLQIMEPAKRDEYAYFMAETHYSVARHSDAASNYEEALSVARVGTNKELQRKILTSLLALIGEEELPKGRNEQLTESAYEAHVSLFPVDEVTHKIYPKLFTLHRQKNHEDKAVRVIEAYNKSYPQDLKQQQEQMLSLIDDMVARKDVSQINTWISEFKKGFLKFGADTIEKTELVLGQILFTRGQELVAKGDYQQAMQDFDTIFKTTLYPPKIRAQAGTEAARLALEVGRTTDAIDWLERSFALYPAKDLEEKTTFLTELLIQMAAMQEFRGAARLSDNLLAMTCKHKKKEQERLFELSVSYHLVLSDDWTQRQNFSTSAKCVDEENRQKVIKNTLVYYADHNALDELYSFYQSYGKGHEELVKEELYYSLADQQWESALTTIGRLDKLGDARATEVGQVMKQLEAWKKQWQSIEQHGKELMPMNIFVAETFTPKLEKYLALIKDWSVAANPVLQSKFQWLARDAHVYLLGAYAMAAQQLENLTPKHEDRDFVRSFKKEMDKLAVVFRKKEKELAGRSMASSGHTHYAASTYLFLPLTIMPMDRLPGSKK